MRAGKSSKPSGTGTDPLNPEIDQPEYGSDFAALLEGSQTIEITLPQWTGQTVLEF